MRIGDTASTSRGDVTVERFDVEDTVARPSSSHVDVVGDDDSFYVVIRVLVGFDSGAIRCLDSENIPQLILGGQTYEHTYGCLYSTDGPRAADVAYEIGTDEQIDRGKIVFERGDSVAVWGLDEEHVQALTARPNTVLSSVSTPAEAEIGEWVTVSVRAENRGASTGSFKLKLDRPDVSTPTYDDFPIDAGETVEKTYGVEMQHLSRSLSAGDSVALVFDSGKREVLREISVR